MYVLSYSISSNDSFTASAPVTDMATDTPVKKGFHIIGTSQRSLTTGEVDKVGNELGNRFCAVQSGDFFKHLLPMDESIIKDIQQKLEKTQYDGKCWKLISKAGGDEKMLYKAFVEVANEINKLVLPNRQAGAMAGTWVDCHNKSPKSQDCRAAAVRPDVVFVSTHTEPQVAQTYSDNINSLEEELNGNQAVPDNTKAQEEQNALRRLWWSLMSNVMEMKSNAFPSEQQNAFTQLCTYARQVLKAQLDRRFVIGLTLCRNELNVFLFDRSGVVGLDQPVDIHKEPSMFVNAVAAFSYLDTEKLGWDPTMGMLWKEKGVPSYQFPWEELENIKDPHSIPWVVESPNDEQKYVSLRSLSIAGSEMLLGRATIVLEVIRLQDYCKRNTDADILVMKQSWQRLPGIRGETELSQMEDNEPFELRIYRMAKFDNRCAYAGYVRSKGKTVNTLEFIRHNIPGTLKQVQDSLNGRQGSKRTRDGSGKGNSHNDRDLRDMEPYYHEVTVPQATGVNREGGQVQLDDRTQTRIFMSLRGVPIKYFRSLKELLQVMYNAIQDHQALFDNGVLHRDASPGNIIINVSPTDSSRHGWLIDFDHSKPTPHFRPWPESKSSPSSTPEIPLDHIKMYQTLHKVTEKVVTMAVAAADIKMEAYLSTMVNRLRLLRPGSTVVSEQDLGWETVDRRPSFQSHVPGPGRRTGTYPFMSHEILSSKPPLHDAIHDLESFWWIIVHLALTREGPGKRRSVPPGSALEATLRNYFDSDRTLLYDFKSRIFKWNFEHADQTLQDDFLAHFHEYFEPIKPLVHNWWMLLKSGFEFECYERVNIHKIVLKLLHDAIGTLPDSDGDLSQKEAQRRAQYREETKQAIQNQKCAYSYPMSPLAEEKANRPVVAAPMSPGSPTPTGRPPKRAKAL